MLEAILTSQSRFSTVPLMPAGRLKEFDRETVLTRAMELFWERGFESASLAQLVEHMGIGRQSLYDTFGDKKALYLEALSHYRKERLRPVLQLLGGDGAPLDRLRSMLELMAEGAKDPTCPGCMLSNGIAEFGAEDPALRDLLGAEIGALDDAIAACVREAVETGDLPRHHDVRGHARLLLAICQGMPLIGRLGVEDDLIDDIVRGAERSLQP